MGRDIRGRIQTLKDIKPKKIRRDAMVRKLDGKENAKAKAIMDKKRRTLEVFIKAED